MPRAVPAHLIALVSGLALALAWTPAPDAAPSARTDNLYRRQGYWEPPRLWADSVTAIVSSVLRGTGSHSQVLGWESTRVRAWLWNPGDTLPATWDPAKVLVIPTPTNVYGTGVATLANGRLMASGGVTSDPVGTRLARWYDPLTRAWTSTADLHTERWYSSALTLEDGRMLVLSGTRFPMATYLGGVDDAGRVLRQPRGLGCGADMVWTDSAKVSATLVTAREGHAAVLDNALGGTVVFGGRRGASYLNDIFTFYYNYFASQPDSWTAVQVPLVGAASPRPAPRHRHALASNRSGDTLWVFGGLDSTGKVLGDVWRLPVAPVGPSSWQQVLPSGGGPGPRYGHTLMFDAGSTQAQDKAARLLVVGGRDSAGGLTDTVWTLTGIAPGQSPQWVVGAVRDSSAAAREGHVMVFDRVNTSPTRRFVVFGGTGRDSIARNDAWLLTRTDSARVSQANEKWTWKQPSIGAAKPLPSPRTRASAVYDELSTRMVVAGGETSHGRVSDIWTLRLNNTSDPTLTLWDSIPGIAPPHEPPLVGRSAATLAFDSRGVAALQPEVYSPATAQWDTVPNGSRYSYSHPRLILLPGGRVFLSGQDSVTQALDLSNGLAPWAPLGGNKHFESWGSAMWEPGKILACGGWTTGDRRTAWIDLNLPNAQWQASTLMDTARMEFNLTVLPSGDVLSIGGVGSSATRATSGIRRVQRWSPVTHAWAVSETLAPNPMLRDVHASAMLLPDGRVWSAGSEFYDLDRKRVTLYWPPYLFDDSGHVAARPAVLSASDSISWGDSLGVGVDDADSIASVVLMRPGAVIHAWDMNQRRVPLGFRRVGGGALRAAIPASSSVLPPGDYLLFLLNFRGTPSVGRWVRVGGTSVIGVPPRPLPGAFALHPPRPNPSSGEVEVAFELPLASRVRASVFEVSGRRVRVLADRRFAAGPGQLRWDGRDSQGRMAGPGVYLLRLEAGTWRGSAKLVRLE